MQQNRRCEVLLSRVWGQPQVGFPLSRVALTEYLQCPWLDDNGISNYTCCIFTFKLPSMSTDNDANAKLFWISNYTCCVFNFKLTSKCFIIWNYSCCIFTFKLPSMSTDNDANCSEFQTTYTAYLPSNYLQCLQVIMKNFHDFK